MDLYTSFFSNLDWTRTFSVTFVFLLFCSTNSVEAADLLACSHDQGLPGGTAQVRIWAETSVDANGWSFSLCHDPTVVEAESVENGITTATVNLGDPPEFLSTVIEPDGIAVGVVVGTTGPQLPVGRNHELHIVTYALVGGEGDSTPLEFCSTIGSPPTTTLFLYGGASFPPDEIQDGMIEIVDAPHVFYAPHAEKTYHEPGTFSFHVGLAAGTIGDFSPETQGFAMSIAYDTTALTAISIEPASVLVGLGGPDFFDLAEYPEGIAGGCVYSLVGAWELLIPTEPIDLVDVQFQTTIDDELGDYHELRWVNGIGGPPPVTNIVVGSGSSWVPILRHGRVRLEHRATPAFIRGDCSASDEIDLGDVLTVLDYLFGPGVGYVDCRDACDIDGDGLLQIGDPISLLEYLFLGGPAPPAPFPECLASAVVLGCETPSCP